MMRALLAMSLVFFAMAVFAMLISLGLAPEDAAMYAAAATVGASIACFGVSKVIP